MMLENRLTVKLLHSRSSLEEGTLYEISVCAMNRAGERPCVESTNRTREVPPEQPSIPMTTL